MTGFIIWYVMGLVGCLLCDYIECKIVNRDYDKYKDDPKTTISYLGGVRPPAYPIVFYSLLGGIFLALSLHSLYHYLKGNYGEFE